MAITSANQLELLQTAEAVAREKMIDPDLVIQAMEESLARAAKSRYGAELDIRVKIDRKTGRASFARIRTVVEDDAVENYQAQLTVAQRETLTGRIDAIYRIAFLVIAAITATGALLALRVPAMRWDDEVAPTE